MRLLELGIPYLNSTLLYGRPGTGKTMFGRYTAYKLGLPFAYVNFSYLIDSYMGNTSKNLKKVFDYCKGKRCVLMLDEIDCIGLKRSGGGDGAGGEIARTTISLMQELDSLTNEQIVIGATNREDRLDPALKRRFFQQEELSMYGAEEREKMAQSEFCYLEGNCLYRIFPVLLAVWPVLGGVVLFLLVRDWASYSMGVKAYFLALYPVMEIVFAALYRVFKKKARPVCRTAHADAPIRAAGGWKNPAGSPT